MVWFGFEWGASHTLEILGGQAELGQDFFVRNDFSPRDGSARLGDMTGLFFTYRLVINRGNRQGNGDRIEHGFEQIDDSGDLSGGQAVDELVSLLFRVCSRPRHSSLSLNYGALQALSGQ